MRKNPMPIGGYTYRRRSYIGAPWVRDNALQMMRSGMNYGDIERRLIALGATNKAIVMAMEAAADQLPPDIARQYKRGVLGHQLFNRALGVFFMALGGIMCVGGIAGIILIAQTPELQTPRKVYIFAGMAVIGLGMFIGGVTTVLNIKKKTTKRTG